MENLPPELESALYEQIVSHELEAWQSQIRELARIAFLLPVEVPADGETAIGASRIGGTPDLPSEWAWPVEDAARDYAEDDEQFLTFLAQINLSELPLSLPGLPRQGWLYAFATQESALDNPNAVLYYDGAVENLSRRPEPPEGTYADGCATTLGALRVKELVPVVSLPCHCRWTGDEDGFIDSGDCDKFDEVRSALIAYPDQSEPVSRLGGYPYDSLMGEAEWDHLHLLLRVESWFRDGVEINFWDAGSQEFSAPSLAPQEGLIPDTAAPITSM